MAIPNMNTGNLRDLDRRLRRLERANPLSSSSLGRGRMRFYDGSELLIENGALNVTGTATIAGTLDVTGVTNLSGVTNVTGPLNISGATAIDGPLSVTDTLNVTAETRLRGKTTVEDDLEITSGGKLTAGATSIEPNGKASFGDLIIDPNSIYMIQAPGGNMVSGSGDQISLSSSSSSSVSLDGSRAELNYKGAAVRVEEAQTTITNRLKVNTLPIAPAGSGPNLWIDSSGVLHQIA